MYERSTSTAAHAPQAQISHATARRDVPVRCRACGRPVERGARQQRFCSTRCRKRDWGKKRCRKAGLAPDAGGATNPPKKLNQVNGVQGAKRVPNPPVFAPARIIERELFAGRQWDRTVSSDGVVSYVVRRRPASGADNG